MNTTPIDTYSDDYVTATDSFFRVTESNSLGGAISAVDVYLISVRILVGILGVLGNLTVCIVVSKLKSNEVKFLIVSQAFIDFLTSFVLVAGTLANLVKHDDGNNSWYIQLVSPKNHAVGYFYCMFWHWEGLLFCLFSISTYNLVAISIERYMAVIYAMWYRTGFTSKKAMLLGAALWMIAPTMQIIFCSMQTAYIDGICYFTWSKQPYLGIIGVCMFLWDYFGPCLIMGYCFTRISMELRTQDFRAKSLKEGGSSSVSTVSGKVSESSADDRKAMSRSRNVTKTFLFVFFAFVLCWATNQFLFLQRNLGGYIYHGNPENHFANTMAILNSTINPVIYMFRYKQYREKLKQIICHRG